MSEYERLNARIRQLVERNNELGKECGGLLGALATASGQRDKIKAELECARGDLKTAMNMAERYRADAERYRFLRDDISHRSHDFCIVKKYWGMVSSPDVILQLESADEQIDSAMKSEVTP